MPQYTRSQAGFLRKPRLLCLPSSSPPPTLWGSCLFRFTPPQGIPRGWLTENTSYWTTQTGPQATCDGACPRTQQQTQTHTQWMHTVCISSPVGDEVEQWGRTWHLKSRSNYFSRRIKVSRSGISYELCSFDTEDVSGGGTARQSTTT